MLGTRSLFSLFALTGAFACGVACAAAVLPAQSFSLVVGGPQTGDAGEGWSPGLRVPDRPLLIPIMLRDAADRPVSPAQRMQDLNPSRRSFVVVGALFGAGLGTVGVFALKRDCTNDLQGIDCRVNISSATLLIVGGAVLGGAAGWIIHKRLYRK